MNSKNKKDTTTTNRNTTNTYDDGNIPEVDLPHDVEPLPESERPRKDGPGGE